MSINDVVCRACMRECSEIRKNLSANFQNLKTVYTDLTLLQVTDDDCLPEYLCTSCSDELLLFKNFKNTCIASDLQLRLKLATIKVEFVDPQNIFFDNLKVEPLGVSDNESNDENIETTGETGSGVGKVLRNRIIEVKSIDASEQNNEILKDTYLINEITTSSSISDVSNGTIKRADVPHKCTYEGCSILFRLKINLEGHLRCHEKGIPLTDCDICFETHTSEYLKQQHRMQQHDNITYECNICNDSFKTRLPYQRHMTSHDVDSAPTNFECDICKRTFELRSSLEEHMLMHRERMMEFPCVLCDRAYDTVQQLNKHQIVHGEKLHKCSLCPKEFYNTTHLNRHLNSHINKGPVQCETCGREFSKLWNLQAHQQKCLRAVAANKEMVYPCTLCDRVYNTFQQLDSHQIIHGPKPYKCSFCSKEFYKNSHLKRHLNTHSVERLFKCEICGINFKAIDGMKRHQIRCHSSTLEGNESLNNVECDICKQTFQSKIYLKKHMFTHMRERNTFPCKLCNRAYDTFQQLENHQIIHGPKPHKCSICSKAFYKTSHLNRHLITHSVERPFKCEICGINFQAIDDKKRHQIRCHSSTLEAKASLNNFECDICKQTFQSKIYIKEHMLMHIRERNKFPCTLCNRAYDTLQQLDSHQRRIHGPKPHKCLVCSKAFYRYSHLTRHLNTHRNEGLVQCETSSTLEGNESLNNFECDICKQMFQSKRYMKEHIFTHISERIAFPCKLCDRVYDTCQQLNSHQIIHGPKPHKCSFCSKAFYKNSHLNRHLITHSVERPFKCEICGIDFKAIDDKKRHQIRCHSSTLEAKASLNNFECVICKEVFHSKRYMKKHMFTHISERNTFSCKLCNRAYDTFQQLDSHQIIHGPKPHKCLVCSKAFYKTSHLNRHLSTHSNERPVQCETCGQKFLRVTSLQQHQQKFHSREEAPKKDFAFICTVCNTKFKTKKYLERHKRNGHGLKVYTCSSCPKAFSSMRNLKTHMNTHNMAKRYFQCKICGKKMTHMQTLKTHQNRCRLLNVSQQPSLLSAEKMVYPCNICDIEFDVKETYQSHVRQYHDFRKHMCTICSKMFATPAHLESHMISHTGERPFKCECCEKEYADKRSFIHHQKTVHLINIGEEGCEKQVFRCAVCNIECSDRLALLRHKTQAHKPKNHKCTICSKSFHLPSKLRQHIRMHTGERPFKCDSCEKDFTQKFYLKNHQKTCHLSGAEGN